MSSTRSPLSLVPLHQSRPSESTRGQDGAGNGVPAAGRGVHAAPLTGNPFDLIDRHARLARHVERARHYLQLSYTAPPERFFHRLRRFTNACELAGLSRAALAFLIEFGHLTTEARRG